MSIKKPASPLPWSLFVTADGQQWVVDANGEPILQGMDNTVDEANISFLLHLTAVLTEE